MSIAERRKQYQKQIDEHFASLRNSLKTLLYSYEKCKNIGEKNEYDLEEQESFEALTARFARTSDILTQKVLKSLFIILQEDIKTIIDAANLLEKLDIIKYADDLLNIREIRNQIAHEYIVSEVTTFYADVMLYLPALEKLIANVEAYYRKLS